MTGRALEIEKRAARWLARRQEPQWSAADQAELEAWLRQSTAHEVAYLRLEYGWSKVDRLAVLKRPPTSQPDQTTRVPAERRWRARHLIWSAAAAALLVSIAFLLSFSGLLATDVYATGIGGHEIVRLSDGSRIELNTDTRVRTNLTRDARSVWLEQGEAYFEVAHEPSRPFVVHAAGRRVTVLGTKFSVRVEPEADRIHLAVTEGRVRLEELRPRVAVPAMIAIGGDSVIADDASMRVEAHSAATVATQLSWRQGLLTFDQTPLSDAAEEFNRYNRTKLVVSAEVANIRIGGSFEATNVAAFARLLRTPFGLRVVESDGEIHISQ